MCPGGSAALGALLNLSQLHPVYNVWYDIVKVGNKGQGSGTAMMLELGGESCFQTLIHMAFLLSPSKWRQWQWHAGGGMDTGSIVIFASLAVSLASIANGALNLCMSGGGDGADVPGAPELFASSWVRKVIFRLYFLCGALLSLGAYAAFWASFGAWTWAVLLPAMVLVRPLAAHACGIIDEDNGLGGTMLYSLLVGPLWLFVDYPIWLIDVAKEGKTALGVLLCGVLSAAEAWLMIALCVGVPSSNLRDTALYYPNTAAAATAPFTNASISMTNATNATNAPLDTLLANGLLGFAAVLTVLKVLFGFVVVRHWKYPRLGLTSVLPS